MCVCLLAAGTAERGGAGQSGAWRGNEAMRGEESRGRHGGSSQDARRGAVGQTGEGVERRGLATSRAKTHRHPDIACTWSCAGRCRQAWVPFVERAAVGWTSRPGGGQGPGRRAPPKEAAEPECSPPHDDPSVQGMAASVLSRLTFGRRFFSAKLCPRLDDAHIAPPLTQRLQPSHHCLSLWPGI